MWWFSKVMLHLMEFITVSVSFRIFFEQKQNSTIRATIFYFLD